MSKRKRDPTFVASEKNLLIELVENHFHVVESKKTDAATVRSKLEEWKKIASEFNAMSCIHPRDWSVLKNCWENLKKRAKHEKTLRNQHFLGTGGGPPKKNMEDPAIERVLELINTRISGYINTYDSDGTCVIASGSQQTQPVIENPSFNSTFCEEQEQQEHISNDTSVTETTSVLEVDWSQYNPSMLRSDISPALARAQSPLPDMDPSIQAPARDDIDNEAQNSQPRTETSHIIATTSASASASVRRRRPIRREGTDTNLTQERIKTICNVNLHADEEHKLNMSILQLQKQKEEVMLEQEKIKLEILKLQLEEAKKNKD